MVLGTSTRQTELGETLGLSVHVQWLWPERFIGLAHPDDLEAAEWPFVTTSW